MKKEQEDKKSICRLTIKIGCNLIATDPRLNIDCYLVIFTHDIN